MKPSLWSKLDAWVRQLAPLTITFLLLLAGVIPLHVPQLEMVAPVLPLIAIYYWTLYRPDLMPLAGVFLVGFLYDALTGAPIGLHAGVFVAVRGIVDAQRRFFLGKNFAIVWLGFGVVLAAALVVNWVLASAFYGAFISSATLAFQFLLTLGSFPLLFWVMMRCQLAVLK